MEERDLGQLHVNEDAALRVARARGLDTALKVQSGELRAIVRRANGTIEDLGVIARYEGVRS